MGLPGAVEAEHEDVADLHLDLPRDLLRAARQVLVPDDARRLLGGVRRLYLWVAKNPYRGVSRKSISKRFLN